jgi:hypothetical protein
MTQPYFCDYLPFEEDLSLNLYNFKFPLPEKTHIKMVFPIVAPSKPRGP